MAVKIVITLDGGLVNRVLSTEPVEVAIVDYDIEGADQEDLTSVPQLETVGPETEQAFARTEAVEVIPDLVEQVFQALA